MMPARDGHGKVVPGSRRGSVEFAAVLWRLIPGPLVRWFARPYVAGGSVEAAVDCAARLLERDVLATMDLLGEEVRDAGQVRRNMGAYERLADALSAHPSLHDGERRASVSIKPSAFTTAGPAEAADHVRALVRYCAERGVPVTIDMEDRRWTATPLNPKTVNTAWAECLRMKSVLIMELAIMRAILVSWGLRIGYRCLARYGFSLNCFATI